MAAPIGVSADEARKATALLPMTGRTDFAQDPAAQPQPTPPNVWAATASNTLPASVADLPPRVYVPHELGGDVAVIDPLSMQIIDRYYVGRTPHHVAPAHDFSQLYVNVMDSTFLTVIVPRTGRPTGTLPAAVPYKLYFSPDGT
jgi:DNA-binding beta-propeller fold protein YncE